MVCVVLNSLLNRILPCAVGRLPCIHDGGLTVLDANASVRRLHRTAAGRGSLSESRMRALIFKRVGWLRDAALVVVEVGDDY